MPPGKACAEFAITMSPFSVGVGWSNRDRVQGILHDPCVGGVVFRDDNPFPVHSGAIVIVPETAPGSGCYRGQSHPKVPAVSKA
jgi:hypothetical protein